MTIKELGEELSELDQEMNKLKAKERRLMDQIRFEQKKKLLPLVGMAFKTDKGNYFMVTGLPEEVWTMNSKMFNPYRIPVLMINPEACGIIKIEEATVYSKAVSAEDAKAKIKEEYEEIPIEEFKAKLEWAFEEIRKYVT